VNPMRAWRVMRKDLSIGPRSPTLLFVVVMPLVATLLVRVVFGSLLAPVPRLGVADEGASQITQAVRELEGIDVAFVESAGRLKEMVQANDLDAGLVLQAGFDGALRAGEQPDLQLFIGGESLASNRIILAVTAADLIRDVAGIPAPIDVQVTAIGDAEVISIESRLVPLLAVMAVVMSGVFLPAAGLVEEKEAKTLDALLVTPARVFDVTAGKGAMGFVLAMTMGIVTLAINGAFGAHPLALTLVLVLAALMAVEVGLILGSWARDANTLMTTMKMGGILLYAPALFFIWPDLPGWIPRMFPTYYFLSPLFEVGIRGAPLGDVAQELAIGFAICAALLPAVLTMGRRMEARLVAG